MGQGGPVGKGDVFRNRVIAMHKKKQLSLSLFKKRHFVHVLLQQCSTEGVKCTLCEKKISEETRAIGRSDGCGLLHMWPGLVKPLALGKR